MSHLRRYRYALLALGLVACAAPTPNEPHDEGDAGHVDHWVHQDAGPTDGAGSPRDAAIVPARDAAPRDALSAHDAADPCAGKACNTPPANTCADAQTLTVYDPSGTCAAGQCHYVSTAMNCPGGCANGACKNDPCAGVTCRTPPANVCGDESHLTVYDATGSCGDGTCSYASHDSYCAFGCVAGACKNDPCAGKTCNAPSANYCKDASTLVAYETPGACSDGTCAYSTHDVFCGFGCLNGACKNDPCAGKTCNMPPARDCKDADTARTYASSGACNDGVCTYAATETSCPHGCASGACKDCVSDGDCPSGKWCDASTCVDCGDTSHCGPSCGVCSGTTPACSGTGVGCQCVGDSCGGGSYCSGGRCLVCDGGACGNGRCDCGETSTTCPADCGPPCPAGLVIGAWSGNDDGWVWNPHSTDETENFWHREAGDMRGGSGNNPYNKSYTQDLTYNSDLNLVQCSSATLAYSVSLSDDSTRGTDKSERLYVQCSGDGGATWTNLTPNPWPNNQGGCNTSYCNGDARTDRSFSWTVQSIALPAACRTVRARVRFEANGSSAWNMALGWSLKQVKIN